MMYTGGKRQPATNRLVTACETRYAFLINAS